mgnify:CR=1 FL=1
MELKQSRWILSDDVENLYRNDYLILQRHPFSSRSGSRNSRDPRGAGLHRARAEFPPAERPVNSKRQIEL